MSDSSSPLPDFDRGTNGLLPAIAQDATSGRVLMMAWMNREAWQETLRTSAATYYSRSRSQLWRKGETSGHRQHVVRIEVDCDGDSILLHVDQKGAACHEGYQSCFFRQVDANGKISVNEQRLVDPKSVYGES
ncbi:MAG: phosphoribosyl-AMP cyclohydrolase [Planctomycetota bacterium]